LISFILNESEIVSNLPNGTPLLDFIRYQQHLTGTKIGCREGDCGACSILVGEIINDRLVYRSATSCLMPLGNAHGKHIVTIEGINMHELNPVQQAMADEGATQCGFCTPGFVMSLAGFCLSDKAPTKENAIAAIDGNICRCTGYKSIERAAEKVSLLIKERSNDPAKYAAEQKILPAYFADIKERLSDLVGKITVKLQHEAPQFSVGGGTDLYVQKHDELKDATLRFLFDRPELKGISRAGNKCIIGPSATVSDIQQSPVMQEIFPNLQQYIALISSTPIRNMATVAGNFINASPIGDLTVFFLALNAQLLLSDGKNERTVALRNLYKGYKQLDRNHEEHIEKIWFEIPPPGSVFNFEKVSKRTNLDIASVNAAIHIRAENGFISNASISAGGVGPIPMYLAKTSAFLSGKEISVENIQEAIAISQTEISPISDARGSAEYKRLLLSQLIKAHFITLFPALNAEKILHA
jgi:xanthine dehydrogenase small subunit